MDTSRRPRYRFIEVLEDNGANVRVHRVAGQLIIETDPEMHTFAEGKLKAERLNNERTRTNDGSRWAIGA